MTSNGYLLDETLIDKAIDKWHLGSVQITIDGTESIYNKIKNYIYDKNSSPYKKVMNNIGLLLEKNMAVVIRINLDTYNIDDSRKLISEIYENFGVRKNLSIYLYPLFDDENPRSKEDEDKIYDSLIELESIILDYGYRYGQYPSEGIMVDHCMADAGTHVVISPDGELGTCEHFIDSDFFSHIDTPWKKDYNILNGWKDYVEALDVCKDCPIYGNCLRPVKCFERHKCSDRVKEWNIRKATYDLINFYNDYERN
jgi:radical SAM protein with 4Fe4S-binding SPASM domain